MPRSCTIYVYANKYTQLRNRSHCAEWTNRRKELKKKNFQIKFFPFFSFFRPSIEPLSFLLVYIYIYTFTVRIRKVKKRVIEGVKERKANVYPRLRKVKFRNKKIRVVSRDRMFHVQLRRKLQLPFFWPAIFLFTI